MLAVADVERAFIYAMAQKLAGNCAKSPAVVLPGFTLTEIPSGSFTVRDVYSCARKFTGVTTVSIGEVPVWIMHYGGRYDDDARAFLHECLCKAFVDDRKFYGGRGPHHVSRHDGMVYVNTLRGRSSFSTFCGEECVYNSRNERRYGSCWYSGGFLLELE